MNISKRRIVAALMPMALAIAACGSSDNASTDAADSTTAPAESVVDTESGESSTTDVSATDASTEVSVGADAMSLFVDGALDVGCDDRGLHAGERQRVHLLSGRGGEFGVDG